MPPFTPCQIDHLVVRVRDVARSLVFYCDILGLERDRLRLEIGLYHLRAGDTLVDLLDIDTPRGGEAGALEGGANMDHFCLLIEPFDGAAITDYLAGHGIEVDEEVTRYGAFGDGPSIYLTDPDGNGVELKGRAGPGGE